MKRLLFSLLLLSFVFGSCHFMGERIRGNGVSKTETRQASGYEAVHVSDNMELHITQGESAPVRIETDENLMQYIEVRTNGNVLEIHAKDHVNLDPTDKINVFVTAPQFKGFRASGACHIIGDTKITSTDGLDIDISGASGARFDLKVPSVEVHVTGASSANLKGETKDFRIDGSGASDVKAFDLMAENVSIDLSGACGADVFASVKLKAHISGATNVHYKGSPSVEQNSSGASNVYKAD